MRVYIPVELETATDSSRASSERDWQRGARGMSGLDSESSQSTSGRH